jgi:hypothetical protein
MKRANPILGHHPRSAVVYFEETPEQAFGILERAPFESRLRAHLSGTLPDDKAWYGLRNVVWASACRTMLSKTASFREASQIS